MTEAEERFHTAMREHRAAVLEQWERTADELRKGIESHIAGRELAIRRELKLAVDAVGERLDLEVDELHRRISEIHERALRELTRLHTERIT